MPEPDPTGDLARLEELRDLADELLADIDRLRRDLTIRLRSAGYTWQQIGDVFGLSAQRAHQISQQQPEEKR